MRARLGIAASEGDELSSGRDDNPIATRRILRRGYSCKEWRVEGEVGEPLFVETGR